MAAVPGLLWGITRLDGTALAAPAPAAALTLVFWALLFGAASKRLRWLMVLGVFAATLGEVVFSLGLEMYSYRQGGIPLYVPPGHTILYAAIFIGTRARLLRRHPRAAAALFYGAAAAFSLAWFHLHADQWGLVCFALFSVLLLAVRGSRAYFSAMYLLVAYLELCGTSAGAWAWPATLMSKPGALTSANPPSGVALFYCLFDLSCLALYFGLRFRSFERWVSYRVAKRSRSAAEVVTRRAGP